MSEARFEKVQRSDACLYGPRKIVLCGFGRDAQPKFKAVIELAGLGDVPLVWAAGQDAPEPVATLFDRPTGPVRGSARPCPGPSSWPASPKTSCTG